MDAADLPAAHAHAQAPAPATAEADEALLRHDLLAAYLRHMRTSMAANVAIAVTTVGVLAATGGAPTAWLAAWLGSIVAITALRVLHWRRLMPRLPALDPAGVAAVERQLTAFIFASGLAWGLLPWIGYTGRDAFVDFFTTAMLVGMTAGAVSSTAALPRGLVVYLSAALVPFIVKSALMDSVVHRAGGLTIVFTWLVLVGFGRNAYRTLRQSLAMTRQNEGLARELRHERDAVQAASRAKDLFLAGVTHDLRQPVHALGLHLRFLRSLRPDELTPQAVAELCTPMDSALGTMSGQLSRLLELSRLEAGESRVARQPVALATLLAASAAQFEPAARDKGLRWRLHGGSAWLDSDPQLLQSIVDNLLSNAVRYTERGGVLLAARRRAGAVLLQVWDTGPGIAAERLPELFVAYRRFDDRRRSGTAAGDGGFGLGLALVRKQADLLGHELGVSSVPGRGSVFTLRVPCPGDVTESGFRFPSHATL